MMSGIQVQDLGIPGLSSKLASNAMDGYTVKYIKADIDDPGDLFQLQEIETKSLKGTEIVLLEKDKFVFMDKYMIILRYLEKNT